MSIEKGLTSRYVRVSDSCLENNSQVVIAYDQQRPGSLVAIKAIGIPSRLESNKVELLRSLSRYLSLNHPSLAKPIDIFVDPRFPHQLRLVVEYIQDAHPLAFSATLPKKEFLELMGQFCSVLHYLHARGFAHLDLHPGNVLLSPSRGSANHWLLKLIDFPFQNLKGLLEDKDELNFSPLYSAPEVLHGGKIDYRADLYSLGLLLYQLLVGELPQLKSDGTSFDDSPLLDTSRLESVTPVFLEPIVRKLLNFDQEKRYQSAFLLFEDINKNLNEAKLEFDPPCPDFYTQILSSVTSSDAFADGIGKLRDWISSKRLTPCRISFAGPVFSGRKAVAKLIAHYLNLEGMPLATVTIGSDAQPLCLLESISSNSGGEPGRLALEQVAISCLDKGSDKIELNNVNPSLPSNTLLLCPVETTFTLISAPLKSNQVSSEHFQFILSPYTDQEACLLIDNLLIPNELSYEAKQNIANAALNLPRLLTTQLTFLVAQRKLLRCGAHWNLSDQQARKVEPAADVLQFLHSTWDSFSELQKSVLALLSLAPYPVPIHSVSDMFSTSVERITTVMEPFVSSFGISHSEDRVLLRSRTLHALVGLAAPRTTQHLAKQALQHLLSKLPDRPSASHGLCAYYARELSDNALAADMAILAAKHYESIIEPASAVDFYQMALSVVENQAHPETASVLSSAIRLLGRLGNREQFLERAQQSEKLLETTDLLPRTSLLLQLSRTYSSFDVFDRALELAQGIINLPDHESTPNNKAEALDIISLIYLRQGKTKEVMHTARRSIRTLAHSGQKHEMFQALEKLAGAFYLEGDYGKALACLKQSFSFQKNRGIRHINSIMSNLGILQMDCGELQAAHRSLVKAVDVAAQSHDLLTDLYTKVNLALCVQLEGNLDASASLYHYVLDRAQKQGYRHVLHSIRLTHGDSLLLRGYLQDALSTLQQVRLDVIGLDSFFADLQIANVFHHLGMQKQSISQLTELRSRIERTNSKVINVLSLLSLANNLITIGDLPSCKDCISEAKRGLPKRHLISALTFRVTVNRMLMAQGEYGAAIRESTLAASIARQRKYSLFLFESWHQLLRCHLAMGDFVEAREVSQRMIGLNRRVKYRLFEPSLLELVADYHSATGDELESKKHLLNARTALLEIAYNISDPELRRHFLNKPDSRALLNRSEGLEDLAYEGFPEPRESPQATRALESIARINEQLHRRDSLKSTLSLIVDEAIRLSEAERGIVFLFDSSGREELKVSQNVGRRSLADARKYTRTALQRIRHGEIVFAADTLTDPSLRASESITQLRIRSVVCVPLRSRNSIIGALYLDSRRPRMAASPELLKSLEIFAQQAASALERAIRYFHLAEENRQLRESALSGVPNLVGQGTYFLGIKKLMAAAANSDLPVLILGESGTGKELVARAIHYSGRRSTEPFLSVDCGALPENLVESELFGYRRGAFTGAYQDKDGLFVAARAGSLFLDEIGNTTLSLQAKLLRAIQEREIRPLGGTATIPFQARLIAATNHDLRRDARDGRFRQDLLFRLNGIAIEIPSLRDRKSEIPILINHFLQKTKVRHPHSIDRISDEAMQTLCRYDWPGNIRELENCIERAIALAQEKTIHLKDLPDSVRSAGVVGWSGKKGEHRLIEEALSRFAGDKSRAAEYIGWNRQKLYRKMAQYNIPMDFGRRNTA